MSSSERSTLSSDASQSPANPLGSGSSYIFTPRAAPDPHPHPTGETLRPGLAEPGSGFRKEEVHLYLCLSLPGREGGGGGERTQDLGEMAV